MQYPMKKEDIKKKIEEFLNNGENTESQIENLAENILIFKKELEYQNEELLRINNQLERKNQFIETLFHSIPEPIVLIDQNFRVIKYNNCALLQLFFSEKTSDDFRKWIDPSSQDAFYKLVTGRLSESVLTTVYQRKYLSRINNIELDESSAFILYLSDITEIEKTKQILAIENQINQIIIEYLNVEVNENTDLQQVFTRVLSSICKVISAEAIVWKQDDILFSSAENTQYHSELLEKCVNFFLSNNESSLHTLSVQKKLMDEAKKSNVFIYHSTEEDLKKYKGSLLLLSKEQIDIQIFQLISLEVSNLFHRFKGEIEIRNSERKFRKLAENTADGLAIIKNNSLVYANDNYFKITGVPRYDKRYQNLSEIFNYIHPEDRESVQSTFFRNTQNKINSFEYEFRILNASGEYIWQFDKVTVDYHPDGSYTLYIISVNIDQKKKQLQWLAMLEKAIQQSPASIVMTDPEGNIQYVNQAFTEITGYTHEDILGKNPRILKSGLVSEETYKELWNTIISGKTWRGEFINRRKNGTLYYESAHISPVIIEEKIAGFIAIKNDITELKEINKKLELLSLVASHTQNMVIITDHNGYTIWVNRSFEKFTGYTLDEMIGKKPGDVLQGKETSKKHINEMSNKLQELKPFTQEILNYTKSGKPYWVELNITPIFDSSGRHTMYISVENDITHKIEQEQKLRESERKNRAILNAIPDLIFIIDRELRYIDYHAFEPGQLLMPPSRFLGRTVPDVMPENSGKIIVDNIKQTFRTAELSEFIFEIDVGNRRRFYEARCVMKDFNSVLLLIRDITKSKEIEFQLKNEQHLLKTVIDNLPNTIYLKDKELKKILVNKAEILYLGKTSEEEVIGRTDFEFYDRKVALGIYKEDIEVLKKGKPLINKIIEYTNHLGDRKFMMISKFPYRDVSENIIGILGIGIDITELKKKEEELQNTIAIITDQNERLRSFTYIVSHNIRAYAANIDGLVELINSELTPASEKNQMLNLLQVASANLMETIKTLNESLAAEKKGKENIQKVNICEVLEKVLKVVKKDIESNDILIINEISKEQNVDFNPAFFESVILNLTTNAIRYRRKDVKSYIKYEYKEENGIKQLEISDNGLGIDLDKYGHKMFRMFETFHMHPESKGLGLFLTKAHIEAMGGKIEVESRVNEGTTFRIIFNPLKQ